MTQNKCKIEIPTQLPDSGLTRVQFKSWKEGMIVYLKQNEDFLHFLPDGMYENWTAAEEKLRITSLHAGDMPPQQGEQEQRHANGAHHENRCTGLESIGWSLR